MIQNCRTWQRTCFETLPRLVPKPATISNSLFDDERTLQEESDMVDEDMVENVVNTVSTAGENSRNIDLIIWRIFIKTLIYLQIPLTI